MNKKERFCYADNIVEWRHIITILSRRIASSKELDRKLKEIFEE